MLSDFFEDFIEIEREERLDGYGGVELVERAGESFRAGLTMLSTQELLIAQQTGKKSQFHVITERKELIQHGLIKQLKTGFYYRITSDSQDKAAPAKTFLYLQAEAERVEC